MLSFASSIFGSNTASKDPERLAANQRAYAAALAGDRNGILYLQGRSGTMGAVNVPGPLGLPDTPGSVSGWAGTVARPDAIMKLQSLGQQTGPTPAAPTQSALQQELARLNNAVRTDVAESVQRIGSGAVTAATSSIAPAGTSGAITIPTDKRTLAMVGLVLVAIAIAIYIVARRG
jgi:hypothetical protein